MCNKHTFASKSRGFTLIEIAIVFSIIGGIIAVIFGVGGMLQSRNTVNQGVDEVGTIANNFRTLYSGRAFPTPAACPPSFATNYAATNMGVFPSDMIKGTVANNPWNPGSATATVYVDLCTLSLSTTVTSFVIRFTNLTAPKACSDVIVRTSALASGANLLQIVATVGSGSQTFSTIPSGTNATGSVDPVTANTTCASASSSTPATIDWYYKLNG